MRTPLEVAFEERHEAWRLRVRRFADARSAKEEAEPATFEEEDRTLRSAVVALGDAGLLEPCVPEAPFFDTRALCIAREELAAVSGLLDVAFAMQGLGSAPLILSATRAHEALLERARRGRAVAAFGLTEPDAGSDVAAVATRADRVEGGYRLRGEKTLISNAGVADFLCVFARTDPEAGRDGLSAFLVDGDAEGVEVVERLRASAPHPLGRIRFTDVFVPEEQLLGAEGEGFSIAMRTLDVFRVTVGAAACGFARRALDEALSFARSRRQFGRPIGDFQAIRHHLAEMAADLDAARLLVYRAATSMDRTGAPSTLLSSTAKLFATEAAQRVVDRAVQVHGGRGVLRGAVPERLYREVRALRLYEGTSEIQRLVIARELLRRGAEED